MEDRHSVSEPRPVDVSDGSMPSWEVDILRDDTLIVDTFALNNDVLPPRTNKKGKVVWRLPDKAAKLPSFGTVDRQRILDIFKERKKKRKQEKKKRNLSPTQGGDPSGSGKCERRDSATKSPGVKGGARGGGTDANGVDQKDSGGGGGAKAKRKGKENGKTSENLSKERDASGSTENGKGRRRTKKDLQSERRASDRVPSNEPQHAQTPPTLTPPPPGLDGSTGHASKGASSVPTSIQHQSQSQSNQIQQQVPSTPDPSRMSISDPHDESAATLQPRPTHERPIPASQTPFIEPLPSDALFITVPRHERPEALPGQPQSSLAVPAARHFVSKYYSHFDGTLPNAPISDLVRYYTTKAQKSVSIGGAHSVVTGRRDIAAQILNLAGAAFVVRGVVAQDAVDGKGVHILVTGNARTSLNGSAGGVLASFAHSVSLVPMDGGISSDGSCPGLRGALEAGYPFLIHNDALALLSGDAGPVTPSSIQQPVQLQQPLHQQPPPPPGLY